VTIIVPAAPGGGLDTTARQLVQAAEPLIGSSSRTSGRERYDRHRRGD
jgi:tripartite-type tricarboxylate transporter receptor subunit TctC